MTGKKERWLGRTILLLFVWILLVLYPNPYRLAASFYRLVHPPLDPLGVEELARELEGAGPEEIQDFVYRLVPYRYDWQVYGMPWYFPTLQESLAHDSGDCKARFIIFASLLDALDIPYELRVSLTHIWVHFEGKEETALENEAETLLVVDESGEPSFRLPRADLERAWRSFRRGFWETMPPLRKTLLLGGIIPISYLGWRLPSLTLLVRRKK